MKKITIAWLIFIPFFSVFSQNYNPDFFPIGVWSVKGDFRPVDDFLFNPETAGAYHQASFQDLKERGFNSVLLSYDPIGYTLDTILKIAETYDMKIISPMQHLHQVINQSNNQEVTDNDIIQAIENDSIVRLKASSAILGYYLYDEPLPGWIDFDVLSNAKNILAQMTADSPHPILSCWNDEQHMNYIDDYLNLEVLMMDAYPIEDGDAYGDLSDYMPSYFYYGDDPMPFSDYINTVRSNHCDAQDRPMWVVLQAFGDLETPENGGYWRQVYPKEIRLQVFLSLMQGAKGIWYFLYESEYPYLLGLLDVSGQPTQRLDEVIEINQEIQIISPILLKLKVNTDQSVLQTDSGEAKLHTHTYTGKQYIFCVNTDVQAPSAPVITLDKSALDYEVIDIIDKINGVSVAFVDTGTQLIITPEIPIASGLLLQLSDQVTSTTEETIKKLQISPNPVITSMHIFHPYTKISHFTVSDLAGKILLSGIVPKNNNINMDYLESGIYLITFFTQKGIFTQEFIKN